MKQQKSAPILILIDETTKAESDEENTDLLNTYFSKQSTIDTQQHPLPTDEKAPSSFLSELYLTSQDVRDAISCIDPSNASGPDSIIHKLIKKAKKN